MSRDEKSTTRGRSASREIVGSCNREVVERLSIESDDKRGREILKRDSQMAVEVNYADRTIRPIDTSEER